MKKIILIGLFLIVAVAVGGITTLSNPQTNKPLQINNVSTNPSLEEFLKINGASAEVSQAYVFALENPQNILSTVKCYCGCLKNQQHKNNRDCFINEDGSFDLMGLNCGLCVKTALISKQMLAEGKSVQEIADFVDARWGKN